MKFLAVGMIVVSLVLAGCVGPQGSGESARAELRTSSDQTSAQKRAQIRMQLAVGYYQQRQLSVALDEIKQALYADPNYADAYSLRGLIYMDMGEVSLAGDNLLKAIKLDPRNPDLSNNYGWYLCQNGREQESIAYFDAAARDKSYESPAKALNNAGTCSLKLKNETAALSYFMRAFQAEPNDPVVNGNLAKLYYLQKNDERARYYLDRAMRRTEHLSADVLWTAIKIEHRAHNTDAEASLINRLRRLHPGSPEYASYLRGAFND